MKTFNLPLRTTTVALAAATLFTAPALAQHSGGRDGRDVRHPAPSLNYVGYSSGYAVSRGDARQAIQACRGAAVQFARDRGGYSARYVGAPFVLRGPKGALRVSGVVRAEQRNGYRTADTLCTTRNGHVKHYSLVR